MNTQQQAIEKENIAIEGNVVPFAKPAEKPPGHDWLRLIPFEKRFLTKRKNSSPVLLTWYGVASPPGLTKSVCLAHEHSNGMPGIAFSWVDSANFSSQNEFVEYLPEPSRQEEGVGEEDGRNNPPVSATSRDNDHYE